MGSEMCIRDSNLTSGVCYDPSRATGDTRHRATRGTPHAAGGGSLAAAPANQLQPTPIRIRMPPLFCSPAVSCAAHKGSLRHPPAHWEILPPQDHPPFWRLAVASSAAAELPCCRLPSPWPMHSGNLYLQWTQHPTNMGDGWALSASINLLQRAPSKCKCLSFPC